MLIASDSILNYAQAESGWLGVNVFFLDQDPAAAAAAHCDVHVIKMLLEYAQLLSTVWHSLHNPATAPLDCLELWEQNKTKPIVYEPVTGAHPLAVFAPPSALNEHWQLHGKRVYNRTHAHHPCAVWLLEGAGNYTWLWRCAMHLAAEYRLRYQRMHATEPVLWQLEVVPPAYSCAGNGAQFTEPPLVMPEHYRAIKTDEQGVDYYDAVESYRRFYAAAKAHLCRYTSRAAPNWLAAAAR